MKNGELFLSTLISPLNENKNNKYIILNINEGIRDTARKKTLTIKSGGGVEEVGWMCE